MNRPPSVSVVLATFNGGRFLRDQLISLANQSSRPDELVVSDDGSTDNTLALVAAFAATAPFPVRIVRNAVRLGYADNFLSAAAHCRSDLIAFCDQDDVWHRAKLRRCVAALQSARAVLVIHHAAVVDAQLRPLGRAKPDFAQTHTLSPRGCELALTHPGFAMVFCAHLIQGLDQLNRPVDHLAPDRPLMAHDQWINFLARNSGPVVHLAEQLAWYRQHADNTCGDAPPSPGAKPFSPTEPDRTAYARRAAASAYYADSLDALARSPGGLRAARWRLSAIQYREQAARYAARSRLYDAAVSWREHGRQFLWLLTRGAYRARLASGLGWRALLKDTASLLRPSAPPRLS